MTSRDAAMLGWHEDTFAAPTLGAQEKRFRSMLGEALATTFAARQLIYTAIICAGIHVLMTWGEVTNWGQHYEMDVCVFRWAHPAGFRSIPVAMVWVIPTDAFLVAFFVCLGQTKRAVDVRRGVLPHVPPDALHRGVLALLFPRGLPFLNGLTSLLGVAIVWGVLWGGVGLGLLAILWALPVNPAAASDPPPAAQSAGVAMCLTGWGYIALRTVWCTVEAELVCAGSYLLWSTKGEDVQQRTVRERADIAAEIDRAERTNRAVAFGVLQPVCFVASIICAPPLLPARPAPRADPALRRRRRLSLPPAPRPAPLCPAAVADAPPPPLRRRAQASSSLCSPPCSATAPSPPSCGCAPWWSPPPRRRRRCSAGR